MKKIVVFIMISFIVTNLFANTFGYLEKGMKVRLKAEKEWGAVYFGEETQGVNGSLSHIMAQDKVGYLENYLGRFSYEITSGTKAKVLETNYTSKLVKVEIQEGPYVKKTGWVLETQLELDRE
ncbi:MAG: hypothetical protein PHP69_02355 [Candidatus Omnitrophica bacterium]|jgi:hypothetical protein|nr:hypothetical protein [Candidatus Omnitrophota bacterium]MDD5080870.1 hypothetical protein [Candidatus Omnitrophota bacterium]MDD5441632.1 hypothetical protein [Candidatus Omnitrophota bacterium]